jgi:hypothetical protein
MYEKKGQMKGSVGQVITLIVGVGVSVLVLIFVGTLGGQTYDLVEDDLDAISLTTVTFNQTVGNVTAVTVGHPNIVTTPVVTNGSDTLDYTGNLTFNLKTGFVNSSDLWNGQEFNFTYTWRNESVPQAIKGGIMSSFNALEQTGSYLPVIVLAVIIALVLGLVFALGMTNNKGNAGGRSTAL